MRKSQELQIEQSELREKTNELLGRDELSDEERTELGTYTTRLQQIEPELRAALVTEAAEDEAATREAGNVPDAEMRERLELRARSRVTNFLTAALRGRRVDGPERELADAAGIADGEIPLELWEPSPQPEQRAVAAVPGTVGVNLDTIQPALFAPSIAPRLGIDMPRVPSGTYASATISTSQSASALAKSAAAAGVAGAMTVGTTVPHRVSARLELTLEDIASVGQDNFEAALRQNLSMALSSELDNQAINGSGSGANTSGILKLLTDPTSTVQEGSTKVARFQDLVGGVAGLIDGLWATMESQVSLVVGVETYRLAAAAFRSASTDLPFSMSYAKLLGGFWTNKRMPAVASKVQSAIGYRMGQPGVRTAVCPHWGAIAIDDMYTGSAKAERYFTAHVLIGDVILVQPDAYEELSIRVEAG